MMDEGGLPDQVMFRGARGGESVSMHTDLCGMAAPRGPPAPVLGLCSYPSVLRSEPTTRDRTEPLKAAGVTTVL